MLILILLCSVGTSLQIFQVILDSHIVDKEPAYLNNRDHYSVN